MNAFWTKVLNCDHVWSESYYKSGDCGTPYCRWTEMYCKKCHVYQTRCQCGFNNGESGWPLGRIVRYWNRKSTVPIAKE